MNIENNYAGAGAVQIINGKPEEKVQPSFFATSSYESYKNVNPKREPETCLWFLHHPTFQGWKQKRCDDIIWLSADPGCGKSVLSRALIDEELVSVEPVTLCYFFFKDNPEQNTATKALCALLHQLLCALCEHRKYDAILQEHVEPSFKKHGDTLRNNFEELWRVFVSVATDPSIGDVVCILDALDECDVADRKKIIDSLNLLYCDARNRIRRGSMLKFFVTSRPYREIEDRFFALTRRFPTIRLAGENESKNISHEISIVMRSELDRISESCGLKDDVKRFLVDEMEKIQNRTYLWLHLTLDEIRNSPGHSKKKVEKAVRVIPETVEEAYEKILGRCEKKEATRVLHIILAAQRPLTLDEIDIALGIRTDPAPRHLVLPDLDCEGENIGKMIRKVCGLFIVVEDKRVFLIHQTAREFLLRKSAEAIVPGMWKQSIDIRDAHRTLSDICVSYLLSPDVYNEKTQFGKYSSSNWSDHVQQACNGDMDWIQRTLKLLDIGNDSSDKRYLILDMSFIWCGGLSHIARYKSLPTILYWAIMLDLADETRYLLQDSFNHRNQESSNDNIIGQNLAAEHCGEELVVHPLDCPRVGVQIMDIIKVAIDHICKKIMALLLNEQRIKIFITKEIAIRIISRFDCDTVSLLFRQRPDIQVSTEITEAAARNQEYGDKVMEFLLKYRKSEVQITEEILQIAAEGGSCGMDFMKIVFQFMGSDVPFTENVFKEALESDDFGAEELKVLLEWWGAGVTFTTKTVELMVKFGFADVLEIVLNQHRIDFGITEQIVKSALRILQSGNKMMELILNRRRAVGIPLAAKAVELIVSGFDEDIAQILFNLDADDLRITEEVVQAAAANGHNRNKIMIYLLNWQQALSIPLEVKIVEAIVREFDGLTVGTLFGQDGLNLRVTEEVVEAAVGNKHSGSEVMEVLLDRRREEVFEAFDQLSGKDPRFEKLPGDYYFCILLNRDGFHYYKR